MARKAHGHIVCLDLVFRHWNRSRHEETEKTENLEKDLKREKEMISERSELDDPALLYI